MGKTILPVIAAAIILAVGLPRFMASGVPWAYGQLQLRQSVEAKFEEYRKAIKDAHQIDITSFKDKMPGGHADGKPVVAYDLNQLLIGINFERDNTKDNLLALELAMDPLERIPDYYTRLEGMYWDCQAEKLRET